MKWLPITQKEVELRYFRSRYATELLVVLSFLPTLFSACVTDNEPATNKAVQFQQVEIPPTKRKTQTPNTTMKAEEHYNRGVRYQGQGAQDQAIQEFQAAIGLRLDYAEAYNNLGITLKLAGKFNESLLG